MSDTENPKQTDRDSFTLPTNQPPPPPPARDDLIGKMMGQYQILEEIGRGGMATVYRAVQQSMSRAVAIKVLPRQMLHDPTFYDRFEREVEVISQLEHPHILPIYDYGQSEGLPFIAMRYLGGGSLEQRIRRGVLGLDEIDRPLRQVSQALDYAHTRGIVHRDLKPGNIMLDEAGNAYLSDFGIARVLGSDLTGSMIIGTPAYMSPEQANGLPIDARSDVYSLGVVLFELITGRGPFQAETPMAVLLKHITEPLPSIRDIRPDVPLEIEQVIQKSTAKDPNERFSSAGELADAYTNALRGQGMANYRPPTNTPRPMQPSTLSAATAPMSPGTGPITGSYATNARRVSGGLLIVGVIVGLLLIGAFFALALNAGGGDGANVATVPTPFPRASTLFDAQYSISMFNDWIPPEDRINESDEDMLRHVWRAPDSSAAVALTILSSALGEGQSIIGAIGSYIRDTYGDEFTDFFVDGDVADDGTVRRSYRIPVLEDGRDISILRGVASPGQLDTFFAERDGQLIVIEMYTADATANTLVGRMQAILDSIRLTLNT